jgi:hypothetical protein
MHNPHSTIHTPRSTVHNSHFAIHNPQFTDHKLQANRTFVHETSGVVTKSAGETKSADLTKSVTLRQDLPDLPSEQIYKESFLPLVIVIMIYDSPLIAKLSECKASQGIANPVLRSGISSKAHMGNSNSIILLDPLTTVVLT